LGRMRIPPFVFKLASKMFDLEAYGYTAQLDPRALEYAFILSEMWGMPPRRVLDIGCAARANVIIPTLCLNGHEVWGIDVRPWNYKHPNFHFVRGDARHMEFQDKWFDVVYDVSAIEHFGLAGRYSVADSDPDADKKAVAQIYRVTKPEAMFLSTKPYGPFYRIEGSFQRVYDREHIKMLFYGWRLEEALLLGENGVASYKDYPQANDKCVLCVKLYKEKVSQKHD